MTRARRDDDWPSDEVLRMLVRESLEHRRAWALIAGLSRRQLEERAAHEQAMKRRPKEVEHVERIKDLEAKVIKQKAALRTLDECRAFERDTEQLLVETLEEIERGRYSTVASAEIASEALFTNRARKGPRPVVEP